MARSDALSSAGLLVLRLGFGIYMASHGFGKVQMLFAGEAFPVDPIGVGPTMSLVLAAFAEFVCALLVAAGLFTRLAAIPVVVTMAVAAFVVHTNDPWTMQPNGHSKEPALLFLTAVLALACTGGGRYSLDAVWLAKKRGDAARAA